MHSSYFAAPLSCILYPYLLLSTILFSRHGPPLVFSPLLFYALLLYQPHPSTPHLPLLSTMYVLPCVLLCCVLFCTITYIILSFLRIRFRLYTPPMPPIHTLLHPQFANYQKVRSARQFLCDVVFCSLSLLLCYSSSRLCITLP